MGFWLQAAGDLMQGNAQKHAALYQSEVAHNNSIIAGRNAEYASAAGQQRAATVGARNAAVGGKIKTAQAANGVDVNSGSAVDVQAGASEAGQLDVLTEENNALLQAYGYKTQASNYDAQSVLDKTEASQALPSAWLKVGSDLISDASSLAGGWAKFGG